MRRRFGRSKRGSYPATDTTRMSKNDRFAAWKCGVYLERLLSRYPARVLDALKLLQWILGSEIERIAYRLTDTYRGSEKEGLRELLKHCSEDPEEYPRIFHKIILTSPKFERSRMFDFILGVLKKKNQSLRRPHQSETEKSIASLQKMFNLTEPETECSLFYFIADAWSDAQEFFINHLGCLRFAGQQEYLPVILDLSQKELPQILHGTLTRIGFLEHHGSQLTVNDEFYQLFQNPSRELRLKAFFTPLPRTVLPLEYHMIEHGETEHVLSLLSEKPQGSTHVLLYGPPGTGKSTYASGIAQRVGVKAYEIIRGDKENTTTKRRAAILACLNMTNAGGGSLIIVDEADNLLNTRFSWFSRGETQDKAWLNQLLEEPGVRMIWITNHIEEIEESVLRRFAYSIHFKTFSPRQRVIIWKNILRKSRASRFFSKQEIAELATTYKLSAGAIDLAVKKAVALAAGTKEKFQTAVRLSLDAHQTLLDSGIKPVNKERVERGYSLMG